MTDTPQEATTPISPPTSSDGTSDTSPIAGKLELAEEIPEETTQSLSLDMEPLVSLSNGKTIRVPKNPHFTRKDVVQAFQSAFELIGGVPRLALWANDNQSDFFKLYARLLPAQSSSALGEANVLRIEMSIARSPLDEQEVPKEVHLAS